MSILSEFKRFKKYTKTNEGYIPSYEKTIASAVCFGDGTDDTNTVEAKLGAIKGITASTSVTETGYAADATVINQLNSNLQDCFQSVSNGKALVASAITDKGISTASDAAFEVLANNIKSISTGPSSVSFTLDLVCTWACHDKGWCYIPTFGFKYAKTTGCEVSVVNNGAQIYADQSCNVPGLTNVNQVVNISGYSRLAFRGSFGKDWNQNIRTYWSVTLFN